MKHGIDYFKRPEIKATMEKAAKKFIKPQEPDAVDQVVKARRREYNAKYFSKPEVKARQREYNAKYFSKPEVKARRREYYQKPEVKARQREYYQKPEVKARQRVAQIKRLEEKLERLKENPSGDK
jgi:bisphosphoglycerate-dependent phosphoglycerate mutase